MIASRRTALAWLAALPLAASGYEFPPVLRDDLAAFAARVAGRHGLEVAALEEVLLEARILPAVLRSAATPGTARPWREFRANHVARSRVEGGVAFWSRHADVLGRAREAHGVPESVVVAILGVETVYGRSTGTHRVLDALATLGFEGGARTAYFQSELEEFLLLGQAGALDARGVRGSYAGAMGWPQFMPSSLRRFGVDADGDGRADLWGSVTDITASVANYLRAHGWRGGADVVLRARVADPAAAAPLVAAGLRPSLDAASLDAAGVVAERALAPGELGALMLFEGEAGPEYWIGLDNFHVITRYNRSQNYAMAVWDLARLVAAQRSPA